MYKKLFLLLIVCSCARNIKKSNLIAGKESIDTYHGVSIKDPYRNLENLKDSTVLEWLQSQGKIADTVLETIPNRDRLVQWQKEFDIQQSAATWGLRITKNGQYFYAKKANGATHYSLYYRKNYDAAEELLFDSSNYHEKEGATYFIDYFRPNWQGDKIAVSVAKEGGKEVSTLLVIDVATKTIARDKIHNSIAGMTGGIQWVPDDSGFIYLKVPITDPQHPDYLLNTSATLYNLDKGIQQQQTVFSKQHDPALPLKAADFPIVSFLGEQAPIVLGLAEGSSLFHDTYYKETAALTSASTPWKLLYKKADKVKKIAINQNDELIFLSAKGASNYQLCSTKRTAPNFDTPNVLVPVSSTEVIDNFVLTKDGIYFVRLKNGVQASLHYLSQGIEKEITLPKPAGKMYLTSRGIHQNNIQVHIGGWLNDIEAYEYNIYSNVFTPKSLVPVYKHPEIEQLTVTTIEVPSHDGTKVPVSMIHKKNLEKNGQNHTLFYGYGSYGGGIKPFYSPGFLLWVIEGGGVLVIAHVRGGGEKGEQWHKAGFKTTKSNTWKDMIAVTEHVMNEGITTPEKSAIWGSSAGGILAGRAMTARPDLYSSVILTSPALNMLRCEIQPNGQNSIKEFGTVEIKEEFDALLDMDSYHHIQSGEDYPATLITAGMQDGRVVVWDPAKFAARLQAETGSQNPVLFDVDFQLGHTASNGSSLEAYEFYANPIAFGLWQTGHPDYQPY